MELGMTDAVTRNKQAVHMATQYAPPLSSLCWRRSASHRRADRNIAVCSHSQYFPTLTIAAALTSGK